MYHTSPSVSVLFSFPSSFIHAAVSIIWTLHIFSVGVWGSFQHLWIIMAQVMKPVFTILNADLLNRGTTIFCPKETQSHNHKVHVLTIYPYFSTWGETLGHSHDACLHLPCFCLHFHHRSSLVRPIPSRWNKIKTFLKSENRINNWYSLDAATKNRS